MQLFRRFRTLAIIFAFCAMIVAGVAVATASAKPVHCPLCCMDVPYYPYYVCWHCCP